MSSKGEKSPIRSALAGAVPEPVRPSSSTVASTLAGAVVTVAVYIVERLAGETLPAPVVAALTTIGVVAFGYFFSGGRSSDTV